MKARNVIRVGSHFNDINYIWFKRVSAAIIVGLQIHRLTDSAVLALFGLSETDTLVMRNLLNPVDLF